MRVSPAESSVLAESVSDVAATTVFQFQEEGRGVLNTLCTYHSANSCRSTFAKSSHGTGKREEVASSHLPLVEVSPLAAVNWVFTTLSTIPEVGLSTVMSYQLNTDGGGSQLPSDGNKL